MSQNPNRVQHCIQTTTFVNSPLSPSSPHAIRLFDGKNKADVLCKNVSCSVFGWSTRILTCLVTCSSIPHTSFKLGACSSPGSCEPAYRGHLMSGCPAFSVRPIHGFRCHQSGPPVIKFPTNRSPESLASTDICAWV